MDELSSTTTHIGEIEELIDEETAHDKDGRRRYAMKQAVSLSTRAGILKNLTLAAKTLAEAEPQGKKAQRQAAAVESSSSGIFAVPEAPKLVVSN